MEINLSKLPAGFILPAGRGSSTILADFDFETYSPAGFEWDAFRNKFRSTYGIKKGLTAVGLARYAQHPDTEVLSLAYNLKDGRGAHLWRPGDVLPVDLFTHIKNGNLLEAWNVSFEYWIWFYVCCAKYNFPELPRAQLRCAMAKSRAFALPGSLDKAGEVLNIKAKKDKRGTQLLNKFSIPRDPTKTDARTRILPTADDADALALWEYNLRDIEAEAACSAVIPDLIPDELEFWQADQAINFRGVQIDMTAVKNCIKVIEQAYTRYNNELSVITGGEVKAASEVARLLKWVRARLGYVATLDDESIEALLQRDISDDVRRALEIRKLIKSASVKKLYAMLHQAGNTGRLHNLFIYHSARTGRAAGAGAQPQNLPSGGLKEVWGCGNCCGDFAPKARDKSCPHCGAAENLTEESDWDIHTVEAVLKTAATQSLDCVEYFWQDSVTAISGCLRGLFISAPGKDLICSDYSAIEAVALAALAGEEWRLEVFRTHGKIYEMSASKITGIPFEDFEKHKKETGQHHPLRKKVGKVAELASGYQGWINAWKQFGADEFFNDDQIKEAVLAWRKASPAIVAMWAKIEEAAHNAVRYPGQSFEYRGIIYTMFQNVLYCKLLSGRNLIYHAPQLNANMERGGYKLSFEGWNTNPKNGGMGWVRIDTYGGRLVENIVQATARDILAHAVVNLERAGYPVVLHVHDEIVSEIPESFGSLNEFEAIMSKMPDWARHFPIKAVGGWRGKRYRKEG